MEREPVRYASIITGIMSVVAALIVFGYLSWSEEQVETFQAMLVAVMPLVIAGVATVRNEVARSQVTPVADPKDNLGRPLVPLLPVGDDEGTP